MASGGASHVQATPAVANIDFSRIFAAACASFFISEGDRPTFASAFNDFLTHMSIKRLTFPRKHLNGHLLQKPEGVLNENLEYFFKTSSIASQVRKKTPDDDDSNHSNPPSSPPENSKSPDSVSSSPPPHLRSTSLSKTSDEHLELYSQ